MEVFICFNITQVSPYFYKNGRLSIGTFFPSQAMKQYSKQETIMRQQKIRFGSYIACPIPSISLDVNTFVK